MLGEENIGNKSGDNLDAVNSLFEQPWWLDAVAPGQWREAVVKKGEVTIARMPYVLGKRRGMPAIAMPPFTQALGPWLRSTGAKYTNQLGQQKQLLDELIQQLPRVDSFYQHLAPSLTNWLPFHWAGYDQTTRYTYRLSNLTDLDVIWADFRENIRREIRKARKVVNVRDDLGLDKLVEVSRRTFERQGMELPYKFDLLERVDKACAAHNARKVFFAEDTSGRVHAAAYVIWDENCAYYILGGSDHELRGSGAASLVMWEAIQFASTVTRSFDFKGSMSESIERFNRSFGAEQIPFHQIMRRSYRMKAVDAVGSVVKKVLRW